MKPNFTLILIFLFCFQDHFAGCGPVHCYSSNGLSVFTYETSQYFNKDKVYITEIDSIELSFTRLGCGSISPGEIFVDNVKIKYISPYSGKIKLLGIPGGYKVQTAYGTLYFTLIMNPVGLTKVTKSEDHISLFPNPAKGEINLLPGSTELKTVRLYNSIGQKLAQFELNTEPLKIPLQNYPAGIYFIYAATFSDKIIIKKITVL